MSEPNASAHTPSPHFSVFCVEDEPAVLESLVRDIQDLTHGCLEVEGFHSAEDLLARMDTDDSGSVPQVPLFVVDHLLPGMSGADLLVQLHGQPELKPSKKVILSGQADMEALNRPLSCGALSGTLRKPWTRKTLEEALRHLLTEYFIQQAPDHLHLLASFVDVEQVGHALASSQAQQQAISQDMQAMQRSFLSDRSLSDDVVESAAMEEIEEALGRPERIHLKAGEMILQEGEHVDHIYLRLEGRVRLFRRVDDRDIIFHSQTAGRVIGLLALAYGKQAFYSCQAESDVVLLPVSYEELDQALQSSPMLSVHFITLLLRSLVRRNRRSVELQLDKNALNIALGRERDQLTQTLGQLEKAQMRLVESEKMATLGQLVAGIAHELNNPIAAINRAAEFALKDTKFLASDHPDAEAFMSFMDKALYHRARSTREQRELASALGKELNNRALGKRLVKIGILDRDAYAQFIDRSQSEEAQTDRITMLECYYQLGSSLRNMHTCAHRIAELVAGLRSFARASKEVANDVQIVEELEETLLLFGHALRDVEVIREYEELPPIQCRPGEVNQVWTNLVSNAIQAMHKKGQLTVRATCPDPKHVQVQVIDSGSGISPEHIDRIFEVNFTTKQGRVEFGLGLGLPICREIVMRHSGQIRVESEPGRTCFTVRLPIEGNMETDADEE